MIAFKTAKELECELANEIANRLAVGIKKNNKANILVSGGSTPIGMFYLLSLKKIDWAKVTIGLVDERYVAHNSTHSNAKLVRENLLINEAVEARFIGLVHILNAEDENIKRADMEYERFVNNVDVCVLGMGEDGHTASLFPNDKASEQDLKQSEVSIIKTQAPSEPKQRISCSKGLILSSDIIYLMITGEAKRLVLQTADAKQLLIAKIINEKSNGVNVYYAEKK